MTHPDFDAYSEYLFQKYFKTFMEEFDVNPCADSGFNQRQDLRTIMTNCNCTVDEMMRELNASD